jgi:hypothetical protein
VNEANDSSAPVRPTPRALGIVVFLGVAHGLWALFQWTQLVAARTGGSSFCGLGESTTCAEVWDSPFATAVQEWTGVPIAGWGLVWSLAATVLPLWALVERAEARRDESPSPFWLGTLWVAGGGLVGVAVLIVASIVHGALCTTCALTYVLVALYGAACFTQTPPTSVSLVRGISPAAVAIAASFAVLFVPGLHTPMSQAAEGRKALLKVAGERVAEKRLDEPRAPSPQPPEPEDPIGRLGLLLDQLPPQLQQVFADELLRYASAEPGTPHAPRDLLGPADAPVRITEFTDTLCGHCANLHETLAQLRSALPPESFSLDARQFPLDSSCNPEIKGDPAHPVRCLAAQAKICLEGREGALDYAKRLYVRQNGLSEEDVYSQAEPWMSREELAACVASDETAAKLADDVAWAMENGIEGTPLVLINGRRVAPFGPLLYALVLTGGDPSNPVFDRLPQGVLRDPHEGHDH